MIKQIIKVSIDKIIIIVITLLISINFDLLFNLDFMNPIQNTIQNFNFIDMFFSKYRNNNFSIDTNIVLVNISNLDRLGIAEQLNIINKFNPKVVGIDVMFQKEKDSITDSIFTNALKNTKKLVLASKLVNYNDSLKRFDSIILPNSKFTKNAEIGYTNFYIEFDKDFRTVREFFPMEYVGNKQFKFFSTIVAELYDKNSYEFLINRKKQFEVINFRRNYDGFINFDYDEIINNRDSLDILNGKIVLLGFMGPSLHEKVTEDIFFTPLNQQYLGRSLPDMYGVVVHANVISMILDKTYFDKVPEIYLIILTAIIVLLVTILFTLLRSKYEKLYEASSLIIVISSFIVLYYFCLMIMDKFYIMIDIKLPFFNLLIIVFTYELYYDSLKPIFLKLFNKINHRK